ncbi:hypothetical protein [Tellurirhabdus rosea]|uniref:hypothetical protein n=1 Tax=Tellurirhabdus rosea TaxID=2674997 RepID=UPI002258AA42|nr:hypothetical protein [Tellurirhabdus rosea]
MNLLFLRVIEFLNPLITRLGADFGQVRAIVELKLRLDNRRTYPAFGQYRQNRQKESGNAFWWMLVIYSLFMGPLAAIFLWITGDQMPLFGFSYAYGVAMTIVAMTLITDFSSVMLDSSDNTIILPRPVSSRTLLVARLLHITLYLLLISLAVELASIVTVFVKFGLLAGLTFMLFGLLSILLVVFLTNLFYLLLMRFTSEEKLREVINYFQIAAAIFFYAIYQILPRMLAFVEDSFTLNIRWWHYLLPPVWLGGAVESLVFQKFDALHLGLVALALLMPFVGLWVMNHYLAPLYNQRLAMLDTDHRSTAAGRPTTDRTGGLARLVARNPVEQAAFAFTWRIMLRDRKFKLKAYPALGYMVVILFMLFWRSGQGWSEEGNRKYLLLLYFANLVGMQVLPFVWHSDQYKAAWLYAVSPLAQPGMLISGAVKAVLVQFCLPVYLITGLITLMLAGPHSIGDILLSWGINASTLVLFALGGNSRMPFSMPLEQVTKGTNTFRVFGIMAAVGLLGFLHYGMASLPYVVWMAIPLAWGGFLLLVRNLQQTPWASVKEA